MNKKLTFGLSAAVILLGGAVLLSFNTKKDKPTFRKIEVIRSIDGEISTYDTLVSADSEYDENDYLRDLGFGNDNHLSIIKFSSDLHSIDFEAMLDDAEKDLKVFKKEIRVDADGLEAEFYSDMEELEQEMKKLHEELGQMKHELGDGQVFIMKEMETLGEGLAEIFSSLPISCDSIQSFSFKLDTNFEFGNFNMMVLGDLDSVLSENLKFDCLKDFDMDVDFDLDINLDGLENLEDLEESDFHFEMFSEKGNQGNFTIVLVTEGIENPTSSSVESSQLKLFPNPAKEYVTVELDLKKKKETTVSISDVSGKLMKTLDLGKVSGLQQYKIDVSDWPSGMYVVQLSHGDYRKIEKLVVE